MELDEVIKNRRSIRRYQEKSVPQEVERELLEAARLAPSGTNRQSWRFALVRDEDLKNRLSEAVVQSFVTRAPLIIVCCLDRKTFIKDMVEKRVEELVEADVLGRDVAEMLYQRKMPHKVEDTKVPVSAYLDLGIAVEHIVLKATSMGLGSCWVRMFDSERAHEILNLPPEIVPVALLPVGYPAEDPPQRPRISLEDIILSVE